MDALAKLLLYLHIGSGFTALVAGVWALSVKPGGNIHRLAGQTFFYAMVSIVVTALVISIIRPNPFLFAVGLFSFFLASTGYRALYTKRLHSGQQLGIVDWMLLACGVVGGLSLVGMGARGLLQNHSFSIVPLTFGTLMLLMTVSDVRRFRQPSPYKLQWLRIHIGRMMGAFIASLTAFSAVNFHFMPIVARWLWPTVLGGVVIAVFMRRYAPGPKAAATREPILRQPAE